MFNPYDFKFYARIWNGDRAQQVTDYFTTVERCRKWCIDNNVKYEEIASDDYYWKQPNARPVIA